MKFNDSLDYSFIPIGDAGECAKHLNKAVGILAGILSRQKGMTSLSLKFDENTFVIIRTRPNIIMIQTGGVFITFVDPTSTVSSTPDPLLSPYQPCIDRYLFDRYDHFSKYPGDTARDPIYSGGHGAIEYKSYVSKSPTTIRDAEVFILGVSDAKTTAKISANLTRYQGISQNKGDWYNKTKAVSWTGDMIYIAGCYGQITLDRQSDEQIVACCLANKSIGVDASGMDATQIAYVAMVITSRISSDSILVGEGRELRNDIRIKTAVFEKPIDSVYTVNAYNERNIRNRPSSEALYIGTIMFGVAIDIIDIPTNFTQNGKQIAIRYITSTYTIPYPGAVVTFPTFTVDIMTFSDDYSSETTQTVFTKLENNDYPNDSWEALEHYTDVVPDGNIFAMIDSSGDWFVEGSYGLEYKAFTVQFYSLWHFDSMDSKDAVAMLELGVINDTLYGSKNIVPDAYTTPTCSGCQINVGYYSVRFGVYFFTVHTFRTEKSGLWYNPDFTHNQNYKVILRQKGINNELYSHIFPEIFKPASGPAGTKLIYPLTNSYLQLYPVRSINNQWKNTDIIPDMNYETETGFNWILTTGRYHPANFNLASNDKVLIICGELSDVNGIAYPADPLPNQAVIDLSHTGQTLVEYTLKVKLDINPDNQDYIYENGRIDTMDIAYPIIGETDYLLLDPPFGMYAVGPGNPAHIEPYEVGVAPYLVYKVHLPMSVTHL